MKIIEILVNREFILRELANQFLQEDDDDEDNDEETETDEFEPVKRLFKSKTSGNNFKFKFLINIH